MATAAGFPSISIDLLNGWPGQTGNCVREDIERAVNLKIHHLSNYNLILEPSAPEYARYCGLLGGEVADEEVGRRNWVIAEELLESKGFIHYETSNFSLPGFACRHNVMTWRGEEYLGIGLGACSHREGERWGNTADFTKYCERSGEPGGAVEYREKLAPEAKARECAVFWLRLFEGADLAEFAERTGFEFVELYRDVLPGLLADGIVIAGGGRIRVGKKYQPVLDSVLECFI
jgi:oxygen-independent coproporphyrinogen-3 oxidase